MSITAIGILVVVFGLLIASFYKPIFGVLGYLTIYVIYNPDIWWGGYLQQYLPRPSFVAVIILLLSSLLHLSKLNWQITRREIELYLFLAIIWLVSVIFGVGIEKGNWIYLEKMTKLFVFIFLFIRVVTSVGHYKYVVWTLVLCACFLAFQAHSVSSGYFTGDRLDALGGIDFREANGLGAFLALTVTFLGVELLRVSWPKRIVYVLAIGLMMNAMIMTQSRAIFLGLLIATPYVLLRAPNGYRMKTFICVLLGAILFFMLADIKFVKRMESIQMGIENKQKEALSRTEFWKASLPMFLDHPLGVGIKNFERLLPNYGPFKNMDAHNTYVLCYSETGILGIMLFMVIIVEALLQIRRIRITIKGTSHEREINLLAFSLGAVLIIYLGGYMMTHSILYSEILWILLTLPICLDNATKKLVDAKTSPAHNRSSKRSFSLWKKSTSQITGT